MLSAPGVVPAYRVVEGISDGVFDFMRRCVIGPIFPPRLTRSLKAAPQKDSAALFNRNLYENESRYLARIQAAYPITDGQRPGAVSQARAWSVWAAREQLDVAAQSFKDTLISRYQLELFGRSSQEYASDRRHWDPGFLTMAGVLGSAVLYLNGMHTTVQIGAVKLGVDLAPGLRFSQALRGEGSGHGLASFELGLKDKPLTVATDWGITAGRLRHERIGLSYRLRF